MNVFTEFPLFYEAILWSFMTWIYLILNKYILLLNKKLLTIIIIIHSYMCIIQIEIHYVAYLDTRNKQQYICLLISLKLFSYLA